MKYQIIRKIASLLIFLLVTIVAFSQLSGVGIGGGGSFSTFNYGDQISEVDMFGNDNKGGGTGGIRFDFDLGSEYMKLSPELFIVQNGAKEFYRDFQFLQEDLINRKVSLDYIGLYLPFTLYLPIENGSGITDAFYNGVLVQARLFADYAINAKIEDDFLGLNEIEFNGKSGRFDYGYSLEAGLVFQGMKFMIGYNWGIKNIEFNNVLGDADSENYLLNNKGLTIQLGYLQKI